MTSQTNKVYRGFVYIKMFLNPKIYHAGDFVYFLSKEKKEFSKTGYKLNRERSMKKSEGRIKEQGYSTVKREGSDLGEGGR